MASTTICPICGEPKPFGGADNYFSERDRLRADGCPLGVCITRERAVAHILMERFGRQTLTSLSVHEAAPSGRSLSLWLSRNVAGYVPSGYFPNLPFGQVINGLRNENIESQTFADGSFDLVLHLDVLEHVFDPFAAIGECVRTLKAGGVCMFTAPTYRERMTSEQVAFLENGALRIAGEPEYHGNPQDPAGGSLVTWRFGYDFARLLHERLAVNVEVRRFEMHDGAVRGYMTEVYIVAPPKGQARHGR